MRRSFSSTGAALPLALAVAFAAGAAAAQDGGCFPKCRSGYVCHEGACVSLCNPPCPEDERCTPEGECAPKQAAPVPAPAPAPPPPAPAPEARPPEPPRVPSGAVAGLAVGAALCASGNEFACNTSAGDAGVHASLRGGYRFLPWLVADADVSVMPLFFKGVDGANLLANAGLGVRFLPIARRGRVDPVLGLHVGYAMLYSDEGTPDIEYSIAHGVFLAYGVGLDFNLSPPFSLGLTLDVFEPFWIASCDRYEPVEYDVATGEGGTPARTACRDYGGSRDQFFFGAGLAGSFFL